MAMEWIKGDFQDMHYNAWEHQRRDLLDAFPIFSDYVEFSVKIKDLNRNKVIRYICFMYDKGSPLPKKIDNLLQMKLEAATLAGFDMDNLKRFSDEVNEMLAGKNKAVNHMIVRFLSFFHDINFMTYKMYKEKYFDVMVQLKESKDPKALETLLKSIKNLTTEIALLEGKIFYPEDTEYLIQAMYEQAEFEELELTPEHIADRLEKGIGIIENPPYGKYSGEKFE